MRKKIFYFYFVVGMLTASTSFSQIKPHQKNKLLPILEKFIKNKKDAKRVKNATVLDEQLGQSKSFKFTTEKDTIAYEVKTIDGRNANSMFIVNGHQKSFYMKEENDVVAEIAGKYIFLSDKKVLYYLCKTKYGNYLLLTGNAEGAQGSFSKIEYDFFIPLDSQSDTGYILTTKQL